MKRQVHLLPIFIFSPLVISGCLTDKMLVDKSKLTGYWLTTAAGVKPTIILDNKKNYLILLDDSTSCDTLPATYRLRGNVLTIFYGPLWMSKNRIIKATDDSLVFKRRGDHEISRYKRRIVSH